MERFIVHRLMQSTRQNYGASAPALRFALIGIVVAVTVMILTISITRGFKSQITNKITNISGHWNITDPRHSDLYGQQAIEYSDSLIQILEKPFITHFQRYVQHSAIICNDSLFNGILLKGIAQDYNTEYLENCIVQGSMPSFTDSIHSGQIVISEHIANLLNISIDDKITVYFIDKHVSLRQLTVKGIYNSNFEQFDNTYCFTDLTTVQTVSGWNRNQISGIEIFVDNTAVYDRYLETAIQLDNLGNSNGSIYYLSTLQENFPDLFAWLDVLNVNVIVILLLVLAVAAFTMISGLLIIIFEKAHTVGVLKALGASNRDIRILFIQIFGRIALRGMIIGNAAGILLLSVQKWFNIIKLDPATYYLDSVPVQFEIWWIVLLNLIVAAVLLAIMLLPAGITRRIMPNTLLRTK